MLFFRLNQVSRECPFLFVYSIRLRNTLSSMMRAMSVVDEAQTSDLLHGYLKSADKRTEFRMVTGISAEALTAPFAFLEIKEGENASGSHQPRQNWRRRG